MPADDVALVDASTTSGAARLDGEGRAYRPGDCSLYVTPGIHRTVKRSEKLEPDRDETEKTDRKSLA
jgi:hypothetical protein